jgi:hypothetical protein
MDLPLNIVVFNGLIVALNAVGIGAILETSSVVEVLSTELVELLGLTVVKFDSKSIPSVVLGLGVGLGASIDLIVVVDPASLLTGAKRSPAARLKHR